MAARDEGLSSRTRAGRWQVAVAPRGPGTGTGDWDGDRGWGQGGLGTTPGSRIEANREKGPNCERRPAPRHAHKEKDPGLGSSWVCNALATLGNESGRVFRVRIE